MIVSLHYDDSLLLVGVSNIYYHKGSKSEPPWLSFDIDHIEVASGDAVVSRHDIYDLVGEQVEWRMMHEQSDR